MSLSLYEQETIINYNQEERTAQIFTYSKALMARIEKLRKRLPDEVTLLREEPTGARAYRRAALISRSRETLARQKENALSVKAKKHTPQGCASGLKTRR